MRLGTWSLRSLLFGSVIAVASFVGGCSGDEETTEEPVEGGEKSDEGKEEAGGEEGGGEEAPPAEEPAAATPAPAPAPAPAPVAPAEPAGFEGAKVSRWVTSFALNVRSGPGKDFPVVRHVKRGDKVDVVINGEWAKLGTNEYISANRLSEKAVGPSKSAGAGKKKGK
jgi:pyruvate/2-oxoglutarate dehydrogenase complex dihydrolipoamide acyltransferase (E2) component